MSAEILAVLGGGSWGTALAKVVADQGVATRLWVRDRDKAARIQETRQNEAYLPGFELPASLVAMSDLERAIDGATVVLTVVPSHGMRIVMTDAKRFIGDDVPVVSASKGIENDSLMTMSELLEHVLPTPSLGRFAYLSGPSFAKDTAAGLPTAVTVACRDEAVGSRVQKLFATPRFRVYTTDDIVGVELGGALKNVVAIAAGIVDGMKLGHNARAALITRGLAEITRLAVKRGAHPQTLAGLAGMGDLVLTCTGDLSRNRKVGMELGQGRKLAEILAGMSMVAEGVRTTKSAYDLAQREGVVMPIVHEVYRVLYEDKSPAEAIVALMTRELRAERD
ncbi:MAG: NAD(P)-dependent glycerol-3-phosphate dehydrogenase [Deltaproteobacteria bacterium]|nr:NAD(P)-dependent glycerol-3-phosphate dehydrogenase [Deltaproteobacteria bacterium]